MIQRSTLVLFSLTAFALGIFSGSVLEKRANDSAKLKEVNTQHRIEQAQDEAAQKVADRVLNGLSQWKQNTKDIVKEMHYEKVKPVFLNDCSTDDYVRLFNSKQDYARKTITGESKAAVQN